MTASFTPSEKFSPFIAGAGLVLAACGAGFSLLWLVALGLVLALVGVVLAALGLRRAAPLFAQVAELTGKADICARADSSIKSFAKACRTVAEGQFEERIQLSGEGNAAMVALGDAINDLIDVTDAYLREASAMFAAAAEEKFYRKIVLTGLRGSYHSGAKTLNGAVDKIRANIVQHMQKAASGFENRVGPIVSTVSSAAVELQASADVMTSLSAETARRAEEAAANVRSITERIQHMGADTGELRSAIEEVGKQSARAASTSDSAVQQMKQAQGAITLMAESAKTIDSVVKLIQDIAWQTNLLALNATIESARAGDAGRGFAVVAAEVKTLADQTARATVDISEKIAAMQAQTGAAVSAIGEVSQSLDNISHIVSSVAAAVEEQSAATSSLTENMNGIAASTEDVTRSTESVNENARETGTNANEVLKAANELSRRAVDLEDVNAAFIAEIKSGAQ